ncbi:hypothetical protein FOCC_FOCC001540 [Frankliniella occidentalis]|nr:hypothetical protein FOCC_FOCC001540 [Frankliniella occidentalis]
MEMGKGKKTASRSKARRRSFTRPRRVRLRAASACVSRDDLTITYPPPSPPSIHYIRILASLSSTVSKSRHHHLQKITFYIERSAFYASMQRLASQSAPGQDNVVMVGMSGDVTGETKAETNQQQQQKQKNSSQSPFHVCIPIRRLFFWPHRAEEDRSAVDAVRDHWPLCHQSFGAERVSERERERERERGGGSVQ